MHPAGILHFASPDFIAVLVIMRKNYKKDSSESVLPGHVRFGQAKKKKSNFLVILVQGAQDSDFTLKAVTKVLGIPFIGWRSARIFSVFQHGCLHKHWQ